MLFWVKSSERQGDSLQTGRKPFPVQLRCQEQNFSANKQICGVCAIKLIATCFSTKRKNAVFWDISLKDTYFFANKPKHILVAMNAKAAHFATKSQIAVFCELRLAASTAVDKNPKHVFGKINGWIASCSPPIEFAPTLCRVCLHTFWGRPHQIQQDELICDEATSRMCQMLRQRQPFWISAIAWNLLGNWVGRMI